MAFDLSSCLVIGISSRALFDLEEENEVYERDGVEAYRILQREREDVFLKPGAGFPLVNALLRLNAIKPAKCRCEVIIMSKNSPDLGLRLFTSARHFGLDITRAAFTSGKPLAPYLQAFSVDLFLSKSITDVQAAIDTGFAAAQIYDSPEQFDPDTDVIRIAFDADSVLFAEDSEVIFKEKGLDAFLVHEAQNALLPLAEGPFAKLLKTLSFLQQQVSAEAPAVRIAIVTARNSPAHERVIRTLRDWNVSVDEAFFLGGVSKDEILKAFRAHIFFDDQDLHVHRAARVVPSARVPYRTISPLSKRKLS